MAQHNEITSKLMTLDEIIDLNEENKERGDSFRRGGGRGGRRPSDKPYSRGPRSSEPGARVYVGNLPWQTSWQDLKDHMRTAGNVVYADVFLDEFGRSKGCGIVEYSTNSEAMTAIKTLNDTKIGDSDRLIFVREDREVGNPRDRAPRGGRRGGSSSYSAPSGDTLGRQVFVRNLPYSTVWSDLKDHFKLFGRVVRAEALIGPDGTPKGQGTVLFETREDAQNAIAKANNTEFQGRVIVVQEDKYA